MSIPIIDLFAGPGGLGEGFSSLKIDDKIRPFKIVLSIEKDPVAHKTLQLRSFYRQFKDSRVPDEYYYYIQGRIGREELFQKYKLEARAASSEAWNAELGKIKHLDVFEKIRKSIGNAKKWALIGGPPCQAYSLVGRSRMRGSDPAAFEKDHRHFLYKEYLKIILDFAPPVFVIENVKGILSSKIDGENIFIKILDDLRCPANAFPNNKQKTRYEIYSIVKDKDAADFDSKSDYVIKSEKHGIPQRRHRVILLGVRSDLNVKPELLSESEKEVKMWEVLSDLPKIRSGLTDIKDSPDNWKRTISEILESSWINNKIKEASLANAIKYCIAKLNDTLDLGNEYLPSDKIPQYRSEWYVDPRISGICNHSARKHIKGDIQRYFFAACFAAEYSKSPKISDFPRQIWPKHENIEEASEGEMFSDRFRVQLRNKPSTTITSHISKDGHYFIHPDPLQCRSLTVREAARLQTFPDNYFFEGPRTSQYHQVGNAVPPLLAYQIAEIVYDVLKRI